MVFFETLAVLGGLKDVFIYNRDLFIFNKDINQMRILQTQKMRVEQTLLFRDDLRDLFNLTIGKMENYLVVNTLTLAFSMAFFYEGRMPHGTPSWLFWLWGMSLATAVLFLILSVWFAVYATITAQTLAVRLLTQWLRLPVPSAADIAKATATAAEFESQPMDALLRIPIVAQDTQSKIASSSSNSGAQSKPSAQESREEESYPRMLNPVLESMLQSEYPSFVEHFHLFRSLQENWAGYDAYARVCMVVGTTQLLSVIGYMGVAWYVSNDSRWGGVVFTILMVVFSIIHARMNLLLSSREFTALSVFILMGPLLGTVTALFGYVDPVNYGTVVAWLTPLAFFFHLLTISFYIAVGSETNGALPTKFSTIISIDILGLWGDHEDHDVDEPERPESPGLGEQALAAGRAAGRAVTGAVTGWQKRWLKATTREAPVSALIPPSLDATRAERERHLRPTNVIPTIPTEAFSFLDNADESSDTPKHVPVHGTLHSPTLPWVAFRQAGAVVILMWLASIAVALYVAIAQTDPPGWDSNPELHIQTSGVSLWTPGISTKQAHNVVAMRVEGADHMLGVTSEGVHYYSDEKNVAFVNDMSNAYFFDEKAPWCAPNERVTMVPMWPGVFRDCYDLSLTWSMVSGPNLDSYPFHSIAGRYAVHQSNHVYRLILRGKGRSIRVDEKLHLPSALHGETLVGIARNDLLLACLTESGNLAVWRDHPREEQIRNVKKLLIPNVVWESIAGAGDRGFVVFGKIHGIGHTWYIENVLAL